MNLFRILLQALLIAAFALPSFSQDDSSQPPYLLHPLTPDEELMLMSLPELKVNPGYANRDLPAIVDNSTQTCMRPAYQQDGLSCGQASMIGYNFTYAMSRERNLNASLQQNQYPTHFAWNFMNGGSGYYGVSYLHSIQILKECGMPNVVDYGGAMGYGGSARWLSGYTPYYNGMHNRINNAYQLYVGDPEGLLVLKNWLHNHLEGSDIGGIASFYAQHMSATQMLPYGTPEAGKYVLTSFGGSPNHAMTIVGYNDSIRWDYNGDGQYTNHLDINNDGTVNMKDWEIGGFKMVQSYGGVPNWGNQGFAYMMYKTVADNLGSGGIWNHCVHILDVKETYEPLLTARVILKHTRRSAVKVFAGIANGQYATEPDVILGFPIFDYQGGEKYMQGGTTEADKTIELGLDLSKLLTYVNLGLPAKVFLSVAEIDPGNAYAGDLIHFSIYDHTSGGQEITCTQSNVPLANNDTTTLSIVRTFNFDRVSILDETLPAAPEGEPYSYQLTASGGTGPYKWEFDKSYDETIQTATFPMVNAVQLNPSNSTSGKVTRALDFEFPFFDTVISSVTVYVDGYLMFDQQLYPYPYFYDDKVLFSVTRNISPFMNQAQELNYSQGCGIWYEGDETQATIRWKTCLTNYPSLQFNYAVRLFPDGTIRFYYGGMNGLADHLWLSGISFGDNYNLQTTAVSNKPSLAANTLINLQRYNYPPEMVIDENGLFQGTPAQAYGSIPISFKVTDNNFIYSTKTLTFSSSGIVVQDSVVSNGDPVIAYNENAFMSVSMMNIRPESVPDATMTIHINDPFITLIDSTEYLGTLVPNQVERFFDAFHFYVSESVPDNHLIVIESVIQSDTNTWESNFFHYAYAPRVESVEVMVDDDNGRLDPGDNAGITVSYVNNGGVSVESLFAILSTEDDFITINQNFGNIPLLQPGATASVTYDLTVDPECPPGHEINFNISLTGSNNYTAADSFNLAVGLYREDFETGDFNLFGWGEGGKRAWRTDTYSPYEGTFSARSGSITHNEESILRIDLEVLADGEISFFKRVVCENDENPANNYDYLAFRIDGIEMDRWDSISEWSAHAYPVNAGFHRFEWIYHKDNSTSFRMDAAWVDLITFPSAVVACPELFVAQPAIEFIMRPGESETQMLTISNNAEGSLDYAALVAGHNPGSGNASTVRSIEGSYLVTDAEYFYTGKEYTWNFQTYNAGYDNEWIKQIYIGFPSGMELTIATDFTGGSGGAMIFQGPMGNGVTAHWFGEDANGWGVVHMGETATAAVTLNTLATIQGEGMIQYEVMGEVYGSPPHTVTGSIPLRNLGPETPWVTMEPMSGTLTGHQVAEVPVTVSSDGLADGTYHSWIILEDDFNHEIIVPVTLTVDQYLGGPEHDAAPGAMSLSVAPNPSRGNTAIRISLKEASTLVATISNQQGMPVRKFFTDNPLKSAEIPWDGKDDSGADLPSGIYLVRVIAGSETGMAKIVLIN